MLKLKNLNVSNHIETNLNVFLSLPELDDDVDPETGERAQG